MNLRDIQSYFENPQNSLPPNTINAIEQFDDDFLVFSLENGSQYIPMPLALVAVYYSNQQSIEVLDENNNPLGFLVLKQSYFTDDEATDYILMAYLIDCETNDSAIKLNKSYFLIEKSSFSNYIQNYKTSSSLWGGFVHEGLPIHQPYQQNLTTINAYPNIIFPSNNVAENYFINNLHRALSLPFAFERFLKLYHLLELRFDYDIVEEIKLLGNDLLGIGQILKNYGKNEYDKLLMVISKSPWDMVRFLPILNSISNYKDISIKIFHDHGKENNPLKQVEFEKIIQSADKFDMNNLLTIKNLKQPDYITFIRKLTCYWIYRIRCCIAHNKIGEFILTDSDENFLVEFAIPLLQELIIQRFQH